MVKRTPSRRKNVMRIALVCGAALYPLVIYIGLRTVSPRLVALLCGAMVVAGALLKQRQQDMLQLLAPVVGVILLCLLSAFFNHSYIMLYTPVLISLNFLISFGYTLFRPPSMVAILAQRATAITFDAQQLRYCRQVTFVWVVFFILNGAVAALTACCATLAVWSLYNGLIAYVAIGLLFTAELCYRYWRFRRYVGLPTDALFKKWFPPRDDAQQRDA
jgi:uncharacterized membrane protein